MGALRRLAGRVRAKPWLAVALVAGVLLVLAWLGWAAYVGSDRGVNEGIGVLVAWPALVAAAVLAALPFVGVYLLIRYLAGDSAAAEETAPTEEREQAEPEGARATKTG